MGIRSFAALALAVFLGGMPLAADGHTFPRQPYAFLQVGPIGGTSRVTAIPVGKPPEGKVWVLGYDPNTGQSGFELETSEFRVVVSGTLNPDPSITYGIAVTDLGAASSFSFIFSTEIIPISTPSVVSSSLVGTLTDVMGDGISITPTNPLVQTADVLERVYSTNMGVDIGPAFAAELGGVGSVYDYGAFTAGPILGPDLPGTRSWTALHTSIGFDMSGGGDTFVLAGSASINQIPEPSTIALACLAGLGLAGLARRRR